MTIIKIASEWNNSHCSMENVDYVLPGWVELTEAFADTWATHGPFVEIHLDNDGDISTMTAAVEMITADIEAYRSAKLEELSTQCKAAIVAGCSVTLSDGSTANFALEETDQINLTAAATAVTMGASGYPYHADGELCRLYSAEDISAISTAATAHKIWHTTYCNHLLTWARRAEEALELRSIVYGAQLPDDLNANMEAVIASAETA